MAYIIRKIQGKTGTTYKAIIRDKAGKQLKSKNFTRRGDAKVWAKRIDADSEKMEALGLRGASMTFAQLVDEYCTAMEQARPESSFSAGILVESTRRMVVKRNRYLIGLEEISWLQTAKP